VEAAADNGKDRTVMEQLIEFNGVRVVLTTGQSMREVQNFVDDGDVFISVYQGATRILLDKEAAHV
jgi:hypothetical protein